MTTTHPTPPRRPTATRRANPWAAAALVLAAAYGVLRATWQVAGRPGDLSPIGPDLVGWPGWSSVVLCAAATSLAAALLWARPRRRVAAGVQAGAWLTAAALWAAGAMLLLDAVGLLFPGLGPETYPVGAASRAACVATGVLLVLAARRRRLLDGVACPGCGRSPGVVDALARRDDLARAAAYVAVGGCLVRVLAQAVVGWSESPFSRGASAVAFEVAFVLAGTLLPLALVHRFGRVWPGWVPGLAGRRVPRPLVLWPAAGVASGISVYFGMVLVQMVAERVRGRNPFPPEDGMDLPEAFFWVAVPAYLVWGLGLGVAALSYARRTRAVCRACGR